MPNIVQKDFYGFVVDSAGNVIGAVNRYGVVAPIGSLPPDVFASQLAAPTSTAALSAQLAGLGVGRGSLRMLIDAAVQQQIRSGDSVPIWQPNQVVAVGTRIFPTAYQSAATFSTGFISANGRLYCLIAVTGGTTGTVEPTWKDPATITNYSYNNTGTGAGQLDITDGSVTWRIRPAIFIDPTNTGTKSGTQLAPYADWSIPAGTAAGWGSIYNDTNGTTSTDQIYAGAVFLQRVGTTYQSAANQPCITIRGPINDTQDSYWNGNTDGQSVLSPRRLTYGAYRVPGDVGAKAFLVGTGATASSATGVVYANQKKRYELLDLDISSQVAGDVQNGLLLYFSTSSSGDGNARVSISGIRSHDCVGGSGAVLATYGGNSTDVSVNGIQINDSSFFGNLGFGALVTGNFAVPISVSGSPQTYSVQYNRCKAWSNGSASAVQAYHHGFSSIAFRLTFGNGVNNGASGWTLVSGTTYSRSVGAAPAGTLTTINALYASTIRSEGGIFPAILSQNFISPTTPSAGEFGYSAGNVYINLGAALDARTQIRFQIAPCKDIQYFGCESHRNNTYLLGSIYVEGHGFASDEFSSALFSQCYSHDNAQSGFLVHYSSNTRILNSLITSNSSSGVYNSCALRTEIAGCDIYDNGSTGVQSIYGSVACSLVNNHIGGHEICGAFRYSDPVAPYNVAAWKYKSGFIGAGNEFIQQSQYRVYNTSTGDTTSGSLLSGDYV